MTPPPSAHLTADDLDAFLAGTATLAAQTHVSTCDTCRTTIQSDAVLVAALHGLPALEPREGFAERVMAQVRVAVPVPVVVVPWPRRVLADRRLRGIAAATVTAMAASVAWTAGNRELFDSWIQQVQVGGGALLSGWAGAIASAITAQAWYEPAREFFASPVRASGVLASLVSLWAGGVLTLRRLVMLPAGPATDARW